MIYIELPDNVGVVRRLILSTKSLIHTTAFDKIHRDISLASPTRVPIEWSATCQTAVNLN